MKIKPALITRALLSVALLTAMQTAMSAGFRLPEYSAYAVATANAIVARDDISATGVNPAAMGFLSGTQVAVDVINLTYDLEVTTTSNNKKTHNAGEDSFIIPGLAISSRINKDWTAGFNVNAPFGLETKWPEDTFPAFNSVATIEPALSKIEMVNYNPNIAYKLDDNTSIALGLDYYEVRDLQFNTHTVNINGKGDGLGWNAALQSQYDDFAVGISYRHSVGTTLTGNYASTATVPVRANLNFPSMLQIGMQYKISKQMAFEFDYERVGWSSFSKLDIVNSSTGSLQTSTTNNWRDSNGYRSNLQVKLSAKSELNFGLAYDESPQTDDYFSARISDSDRVLYSLGYRYTFDTITFDMGYMRVDFKERNVNSSNTYAFPTGEPNGTTVYNGTYNAQADLFGIGLSVKF